MESIPELDQSLMLTGVPKGFGNSSNETVPVLHPRHLIAEQLDKYFFTVEPLYLNMFKWVALPDVCAQFCNECNIPVSTFTEYKYDRAVFKFHNLYGYSIWSCNIAYKEYFKKWLMSCVYKFEDTRIEDTRIEVKCGTFIITDPKEQTSLAAMDFYLPQVYTYYFVHRPRVIVQANGLAEVSMGVEQNHENSTPS